jgi:hypothetical protein
MNSGINTNKPDNVAAATTTVNAISTRPLTIVWPLTPADKTHKKKILSAIFGIQFSRIEVNGVAYEVPNGYLKVANTLIKTNSKELRFSCPKMNILSETTDSIENIYDIFGIDYVIVLTDQRLIKLSNCVDEKTEFIDHNTLNLKLKTTIAPTHDENAIVELFGYHYIQVIREGVCYWVLLEHEGSSEILRGI